MMTRRDWLERVLGSVVAAAVAPLVDLTDLTPAFWNQPAIRKVMPFIVTFPDGLTFRFTGVVVRETMRPDGAVEFEVKSVGPMDLAREFRQAEPKPGDTVESYELAPSGSPSTLLSRDGMVIGELTDIAPPSLRRAEFDVDDAMDGYVLGSLKREPATFTVSFKTRQV